MMAMLTRPLVFVAVITVGAMGLSGLLVAGSMLAAPPVTVSVHAHEEGVQMWIPVPSLWLTTAVRALPMDEFLEDLDDDQREMLAGSTRLFTALDRAGDAELVRVETGTETVVIRKQGRQFLITVRSAEADVDLRVPASTLKSLTRHLTT